MTENEYWAAPATQRDLARLNFSALVSAIMPAFEALNSWDRREFIEAFERRDAELRARAESKQRAEPKRRKERKPPPNPGPIKETAAELLGEILAQTKLHPAHQYVAGAIGRNATLLQRMFDGTPAGKRADTHLRQLLRRRKENATPEFLAWIAEQVMRLAKILKVDRTEIEQVCAGLVDGRMAAL